LSDDVKFEENGKKNHFVIFTNELTMAINFFTEEKLI